MLNYDKLGSCKDAKKGDLILVEFGFKDFSGERAINTFKVHQVTRDKSIVLENGTIVDSTTGSVSGHSEYPKAYLVEKREELSVKQELHRRELIRQIILLCNSNLSYDDVYKTAKTLGVKDKKIRK